MPKLHSDTLCWGCQNFSKCSWSRGVPIEGWDATPTIINEIHNGNVVNTPSFCVHSCPQFVADKIRELRSEDVLEILGIKMTTFYTNMRMPKGREKILKELREKGYKLYKEELGIKLKRYYLENLNG